ncbi:MAG: recombinase family protein [Eubacteriales bacterium]|nr:recombinase family protein [Eubacteriales bacterium]
MKIWLYYRLSRDEDEELNSLTNQRKIIYDYAMAQGYEVVGESFDDNVSGMHFNRAGIDKIYDAVEAGGIDAVLVKDLSRLGRHRTQTALFIDYLREHDVRVLSATENIDTFDENDDLIIGFKGLMNDFYARDGSRRVRTGLRMKQKEGMVIIPPFGYFKDKNTRQIVIVEQAAETVRLIFSLYMSGHGFKSIAKTLNGQRRKTPSQTQMELLRKRPPNTHSGIRKKYLWDAAMVKRILCDEIYTGTLICHKSERSKINKTFRLTNAAEQFRHEGFLPAILSKELWEQAQLLLSERKTSHARAGSKHALLRYGGLLRCRDCGRTLVGKRIQLKGGERVEYRCDTYHRYGKEHCSAHTVQEGLLDALITDELKACKRMYQANWDALDCLIARWTPSQTMAREQTGKLATRISSIEEELEVILMERIRDKANAERYNRMIEKREAEIAVIKKQIAELESVEEVLRKRQADMKRDIRLMDEILESGSISEAQLRLLVEKIYVSEQDGKLNLEIRLKAPFRSHLDHYDQGEIVDVDLSLEYDFDRLKSIIMEEFSAE